MIKSFFKIFTIVFYFSTIPIYSSLNLTVKIEFNEYFYNQFDENEVWEGLNSTEVKNFIISRVTDDFDDYGINVSTTTGSIIVQMVNTLGSSTYGYSSSGIGSYEYSSPLAQIDCENISLSEAFDIQSEVTVSRVGTFISNVISHEVGHILGLYHAYAYEAYDPTISGALIYTGYPKEPHESSFPSIIINNSYNTSSHLMSTISFSTTHENEATIDMVFSDYSDNIIDFVVNEGGTIQQNMYWSFYCRNIYEPKQNIIVPSGKTLLISGYKTNNATSNEETWKFKNNSSLIVYGGLIINVNQSTLPYRKPIIFDFISPNSSIKNGIKINSGGTIEIEYSEIKNAYRGIYIKNGTHTITDNYIHNISQYGIEVDGATNTYIRDNTIKNCKGGIWAYGNQTIKLHGYGLNKIEGYSSSGHAVFVTGGTAHLGEYHSQGKNSFNYNSPYTVIYNSSSNDILAEKNYWGGTPQSSWFGGSGDVEWDFPLSSAPGGVGSALGKTIEPDLSPDRMLFAEAMELADSNSHEEASKKFKELVKDYPDSKFAGLSLTWAMSSDIISNDFTKQSNYLNTLKEHENKKVRDNQVLWSAALESETGNKEAVEEIISSVPLDENVGVE